MRNIKDFGQYIAKSRKKAGMTQETFAMQLGITPQAVSKWENGIGYPDVALFPAIAQALGISIESLFVEQPYPSDGFPDTYNELPFVFSSDERACYSTKDVSHISETVAHFKDGSSADITQALVKNCGQGEILFLESDEASALWGMDRPTSYSETLDPFSSLSVLISRACDIRIVKAEDGVPRLKAGGSQCFVSSLRVKVQNDALTVTTRDHTAQTGEHDRNHLTVCVPADAKTLHLHIIGCADCRIDPDFDEVSIAIHGDGNISAANADTVDASIHGTGTVTVHRARRVKIHIHGSGYLSVHEITEMLETDIRGNGSVTVTGAIDTLSCYIQGSGKLDGRHLTVNEATIFAQAAEIHIGRIIRSSTEKLSKGSRLYVDRRG